MDLAYTMIEIKEIYKKHHNGEEMPEDYEKSLVKDAKERGCHIPGILPEDKPKKKNISYLYNKGHARKYMLKKYGLTPEQYEQMVEAQGGCCAICGTHKSKLKKNLCVDHDHRTDKVRGLLCNRCNSTITPVENRVEFFQKAINYLTIYSSS